MYSYVKKILDVSKDKDVEILVARDMLISAGENAEKVNYAFDIVHEYYEIITFFRRIKDEDGIKAVCELCVSDKKDELRMFIKQIREDNDF